MPSNHLILIIPFSSCFQSFPTSGSFQMSQLLASGGQNIGVSCSWPQLCLALCYSMEPGGLLCPWNFPGKNIEGGYIYIYSLLISISPYSSFLSPHLYIYIFPSNICILCVCNLVLCVGMYFYIYIVEITLNTNLYFLHLWIAHNMRYSDIILKKRPFISVSIFAIEFYLGIMS